MSCDIDFQKNGFQTAYLNIACPRNTSAWGVIPIPIYFFKNGDGPKILMTAGAHGDELEGPVALKRIVNFLKNKTDDIKGQVCIVPAMNIPALNTNTRLSPLDGRDLNRSFPGMNIETVTGRITEFVSQQLVEPADIVVDLHSGGNSLDFVPCAIMHKLSDKDMYNKTKNALEAFNAPYTLELEEIDADGMLDTYVEKKNKIFVTTELRGGGRVSPEATNIAETGLKRLLSHFEVLPQIFDQSIQSKVYEVPGSDNFIHSPQPGIFEPLKSLSENVRAGEVIGYVHNFNSNQDTPLECKSKVDGEVLAIRAKALSEPGDCLFMIGQAQ
ncbi:MAG: succinylglutamate desuccinylase/aspartoacylase family protein [Bdellovibrionales bacterium]|nr:succinylglutamate desuccinylase/aspartoacylase family protein [Bdellovibrionales bacterium]